ncbi:hypothetical protein FQA39_LY12160 [Lamprigera yunnana]|nr:hypothetical protein FQA39_LY12160 [Lamprigera yunnana]
MVNCVVIERSDSPFSNLVTDKDCDEQMEWIKNQLKTNQHNRRDHLSKIHTIHEELLFRLIAATVQKGVSGFKACGIHPLNESIIPDYAYRYNENESTTVSTTPVAPAAATASPTLSATVPAPALTTTAKDQEITTNPALPTAPADLEGIAAIPFTSFYDIRRIPTISSPSGRASNRKQHAQILTSPDVIAAKRTKKEKNESYC